MSMRRFPRTRIIRRAVAEVLETRQLLSATFYTVTDIGTLPGGSSSVATAVNASGEVVGFSDTDGLNDRDHAFLWTAGGGMQDLGTLPGDVFSHAEAINTAGDVVGFSQNSLKIDTAFLWTPGGGMISLGSLVSGLSSSAFGINDSNMVVGQSDLTANAGITRAFLWTQASGMQTLGALGTSGSNSSFATAINNSGEVVGSSQIDNGDYHAFAKNSGSAMQDLGTLGSDSTSVAFGINASGQIVGSSTGDINTTAFLFSGGTMSALQDLGGGLSEGDAINASGLAVGFSEDPVSQFIDASTWDSSLALTDLNAQIPASAGWGLDQARAINDGGMIVGSGAAPDGQEHGFLLSPDSTGPGAVVFAPDLDVAGATETVNVFYYSDTSTINTSSIDGSDLTVTGPNGSTLGVTLKDIVGGGGFVQADYNITPPAAGGGTWNAADTGTYAVAVVPGSVTDANGAGVSTDTTTFDCNLTVDPTFAPSTNGRVALAFTVEQVIQESNGNILSIGHRGDTANNDSQGVLESFTPTNTIDSTFATTSNGVVSTPMTDNDAFYSAAIQPDGKIVAVGGSNGKFLVARYDANGTPDTTFGNNGLATADFGANDPATGSVVVIQPNGSILVAGDAKGLFAIARFTSAGRLDSTFNPGGSDDSAFPSGGQRTVATGGVSLITDIALQGDGKILGVGNSGTGVDAFRLNTDGSNDTSFGAGGIATLSQLASQGANDHAANLEALGIQPNGDVLVGGQAAAGGFGVVRLTSGGQVDSTFTGGGFTSIGFGGQNDRADDVVVSPGDGSFILIGTTDASGATQTAIAAFQPDGAINTNFGLNGKSVFSAATTRGIRTVAGTTDAFHPQLSDFARGDMQPNGAVLINNANPGEGSIRRIQPFSNSGPAPVSFGKIGRKNVKLPAFALANGTLVTITLAGGGSGTELTSGNDVTLTLTGTAALTIKTRGGAGTVNLSSVTANNKLLSFNAPTAVVDGTFSALGPAGNITLGGVSGALHAAGSIINLKVASVSGVVQAAGSINSATVASMTGSLSCGGILRTAKLGTVTGTIAAGASINNISAGSLSGATLLAGTNLGADGLLGGAGSNADSYAGGQILNMRVTGSIATSFIGAGVNPTDGLYANGNDTAAGVSAIKSLTVKGGVDPTTHFEAVVFPRYVHIPLKDSPIADAKFIIL